MLGARIKWSWICSNQVEDQQGNWGQEAESRKEDRKRRQGTAEMSRNVFEDLDTICLHAGTDVYSLLNIFLLLSK